MTIGKPATEVINRDEEIATLTDNLSNPSKHINYALIGPRRIGKTTILLRVKQELEKKGVITVYVDLSIYKFSPYDFAQNVMSQITKTYARDLGKIEKATTTLNSLLKTLAKLKKLRLTLEPTVDEQGQFSIQIRPELEETQDHRNLFMLAFDYANEISKKAGKRIVIIIDEFPSLIEFRHYPKLQATNELFRSILETRANVEYVVSGSRVHFMKTILGNGQSPLFGHFIIMEIKPLSREHAIQLFIKAARTTLREAEIAYELVGGHPYYLIMLAENRKPGESLQQTYERILTTSTGALHLYVNYILKEDLGSSTKETRLLRVLEAISRGKNTAAHIARHARIKLSSLPYYLQELEKYDLIERNDGEYSIKDKIIKDYFTGNI